jgi:hypothetical protein
VVIDTSGSSFDTTLGVYTGSAVNALTTIAGDNNSGPNLTSRVTFAVTAGVLYHIAVDGTGGASGTIQLNLVLTAPPTAGTTVNLATWNFDTTPYPTPIPASSGTGSIDTTGWGGTVTNFGGVTGQALALVPGASGDGTYIEFDFSMAGYRGLNLSFATRSNGATSFTSGTWSGSANGGPFNTLPGVNTATSSTSFETKTVDFSGQTVLNNAAGVRLRYTLSGSTNQSANVRIDDFVVSAVLTPTVNVVVNTSDAYEANSQPATLTVSSSLAAPAGGLVVTFQLTGTATRPGQSGADYSLSGISTATTVTIPAGATSATVTLTPVADNDPTEFDETAILTVQAGTTYFVGGSNAGTITIHDDTPYNSTWASQYSALQGASAAPTADVEKDGISNLLEFAFNGDPFHSDLGILPIMGEMDFADPADGNAVKPYPTIMFNRRTDAPDLTYSVETSTDLTNWTNDAEQISASPTADPNIEQVVYRGLNPLRGLNSVTPFFMRVRVTAE